MKIKVGDIYEDCSYHPVFCTEIDGDNIAGISLIDGSFPRSCSIKHCGVTKLSLKQTMEIKKNGPSESKKQHINNLMSYDCWTFDKWWKD